MLTVFSTTGSNYFLTKKIIGRDDSEPNDTQHNDTGHDGLNCDTLCNDTKNNGHNCDIQPNVAALSFVMWSANKLIVIMLSVIIPSVIC
jgi:hypothetical protein